MDQAGSPAVRERLARVRAGLAATHDPARREELFAEFGHLSTLAQSHDPIETEDETLVVDAAGHTETWEDALALQGAGIQPAEFARITAPVVLLHGDTDPHPGPMIRDSLAPHLRQLEYVELSRCGHLPWTERHAREAFAHELRRVLAGP
jgi:pimeloyl-ACP methyl ester carboxylesterase